MATSNLSRRLELLEARLIPVGEERTLTIQIVRRLRRLEGQGRPKVNERGETAAEVIRARRRRRLEAAGLAHEQPSREIFAGAQSRSEVMRLVRRRSRDRAVAAQLAT